MEEAVRAIVRPSERLKLVLEARDPTADDDQKAIRVLAVVIHVVQTENIPAELEQGCLLVLKAVRREVASGFPSLLLHEAIPIRESFDLSMSQQQTSTLDLRKGSNSSPRTEMGLTIKPPPVPRSPSQTAAHPSEPFTLVTSDLDHLRKLLKECKRLHDISNSYQAAGLNANSLAATPLAEDQAWPWLTPYLHFHHPSSAAEIPISYALPMDLRLLHPSPAPSSILSSRSNLTDYTTTASALYTRLSPARAGAPGDAAADMDAIRDAWIRARVVSKLGLDADDAKEFHLYDQLSIHAGTFNVNGKLPHDSTDLSLWLGQAKQESTIPPMPAVSPLEVPLPSDDDLSSTPTQEGSKLSASTSTKSHKKASSYFPKRRADIIALGFQELDLSTTALIYATDKSREEAWSKIVLRTLNSGSSASKDGVYVKLASKQLVGMLLMIFVRAPLVPCFSSIHTTSIAAGLMGVMGNKGGVAIRLGYTPPEQAIAQAKPSKITTETAPAKNVDPTDIPLPSSAISTTFPSSTSVASSSASTTTKSSTSTSREPIASISASTLTSSAERKPTIITFVNSHLAAFDEMVDRRNADFADLSKRLQFDVNIAVPGFKPGAQATWPPQEPTTNLYTGVYDSDVLFWMGDLNYRIDLPDAQVRSLLATVDKDKHGKKRAVSKESVELLRRYDQLHRAQRDGKAFVGFHEGEITHMPTYRYSPGLLTDSLGYDTKRKPAWTDRVLYIAAPSTHVEQTSYDWHPEVTQSDHKPVSAAFHVEVPTAKLTTYDKAVKDLWRKVAGIEEAEDPPELLLSEKVIELEKISYEKEIVKSVSIKNTSRVPAIWRLVPEENATAPVPDWMTVDPPCGLLLPDETAQITIKILVTKKLATDLNLGSRRLEHTLILRAILGTDYFIAIGGDYEPTVFGNSLETLSRLSGSIRRTNGVSELRDPDKARGNAKEVMKLVGWLMDKGSAEEGLFTIPGDQALVNKMREALDEDRDLPAGPDDKTTASAVATTLLAFLRSLSVPVIPSSLHPQIVATVDREDAYTQLSLFPAASVNIWVSLNAFLHYHIRQQASTTQDPDATVEVLADEFADIFAPVLMWDEENTVAPASPEDKRRFLKFFITD